MRVSLANGEASGGSTDVNGRAWVVDSIVRGAPSTKMSKMSISSKSDPDAEKKIAKLKGELEKSQKTVNDLVLERDFYFQKIVSVEHLCQEDDHKDSELSNRVMKILYNKEEEAAAAEDV